jgi:hypothetical protein
MVTDQELFTLWEPYRELRVPPEQPMLLWSDRGCGIGIWSEWGPSVPYGPLQLPDGARIYRYVRLKNNLAGINWIPEVGGWPELQHFLEVLNAPSSPIESVGCGSGFVPSQIQGGPPVLLGSYVDVIFTKPELNDRPENLLLLANHFAQAVENCERWWADIGLVLLRMKWLDGAHSPWGLMFTVKNYGQTEEEARRFWGASHARLTKAAESLSPDFPRNVW